VPVREERPARAAAPTARAAQTARSAPQPAADYLDDSDEGYRPTVEPAKADDAEPAWNGPVPSFLSFGAA
jgi:hypothetical protein